MAVRILSPTNSFVQFGGSSQVTSCLWPDLTEVLPVVNDDDVNFQFILETDTKDESDTLCADMGTLVRIGIALYCNATDLKLFTDLPERYRIDDTHVLYNWVHGLPAFGTVISDGQCFIIKVTVTLDDITYNECSNIFKRFLDTCFTAVLDYSNDDNFADFNYCGGISIDEQAQDCTPIEISFTNQTLINIPYTAQLQAKFGSVPSVTIWIYDDSGSLVDAGLRATLDSFPPTVIKIDLGGSASGVVKIS